MKAGKNKTTAKAAAAKHAAPKKRTRAKSSVAAKPAKPRAARSAKPRTSSTAKAPARRKPVKRPGPIAETVPVPAANAVEYPTVSLIESKPEPVPAVLLDRAPSEREENPAPLNGEAAVPWPATEDTIRQRAYDIFIRRNGAPGDAEGDWRVAREELGCA